MDVRPLSGPAHPPSRSPLERTSCSDTSRLATNRRPASPGISPTANPLSTSHQTDSAPLPSRASAMPPPKTPPIATSAYSSSPHLHFAFGLGFFRGPCKSPPIYTCAVSPAILPRAPHLCVNEAFEMMNRTRQKNLVNFWALGGLRLTQEK